MGMGTAAFELITITKRCVISVLVCVGTEFRVWQFLCFVFIQGFQSGNTKHQPRQNGECKSDQRTLQVLSGALLFPSSPMDALTALLIIGSPP